ncbi:MAG TPA: thioredoxin family protein [Methylomirabilota bacterium]|nr:thioredoxin family protein [Methylomirabilota bacterium]
MTPERFAQGMTLPEYLAQMRTNRDRFAKRMAEALITPDDLEAIRARRLKILVITEDWCGDALVGFPALARLVEGAPDVEMRVFLRDANPDVMDQYLKRGLYRTIPVFVLFDERMNEVARFMERQDVVTELRTLPKV